MNKLISLAAAGLIALGLTACEQPAPRKEVETRMIVSEVFNQPGACFLRVRPEGKPDAAPTLLRYQTSLGDGSSIRKSAYETCKASMPGDLRIQRTYVSAQSADDTEN